MKRKVDLFEYNDNDGVGRLRTTTPSQEIAIAEKLEANMMTKAQFNALAEERKANRAGSGFDSFGWGSIANPSTDTIINEGLWVRSTLPNMIHLSRSDTVTTGVSRSKTPIITIDGVLHKVYDAGGDRISLPTAPNIYPHDTVLTAEQIASGVIKHADSSNSGLIVNGKFDVDTSGWASATNFPAILSNANGKLRVTATNNYGRAMQGFSTVIGKKYFIKGQKTLISGTATVQINLTNNLGADSLINVTDIGEFTATATTTYVACAVAGPASSGAVAEFDNIAVYPADAISRSDLVFLESWHEDVSEKNFVYPLGNVQYLGGDTDGLTGIANGSFSGYETYSLFGNWQTPSGLIGKGYVWSNLTEAQKRAFIANPDNNCYLDGDKVIQVRYRVRVVQGLGDSWYTVNPQGKSYMCYIETASNFVAAKGKVVSLPSDFRVANTNVFIPSSTYSNSLIKENGIFEMRTIEDVSGFAYEGKCFALPIALVHRRNQGMYHPVYNPNGSKKASDGNFWYNTAVSFTSISDCFDTTKLLTASGYIGSVSGRPDGLFYDQVHESDILDLRNSSKKVEDYNRLIGREFNKLVAGTTRGKEGETQIIAIRTFTKSSTFGISHDRFYFGITGSSYPEIALYPEHNLEFTLVGSNGSVYNTRQVLNIPTAGVMYIPLAGNAQVYIPIDGKNTAASMNTLFPDGTTITVIVVKRTTRTKSNTLLYCDIIGNPSNYPASWKESGVFGTPLIVAEDGTSLLPDGVKDSFKLSRKANATPLLCLRSTDNGVTWTSFTPTFNIIANEISLTDEPAGNLVLVYYQTKTSMAVPVANNEVLEIGEVFSANYSESQHGQYLCGTLLGKVPVWYGKSQGYPLKNYELFGKAFWSNSARAPIHETLTFNQFGTSNPAVKVLPYLTRLNGKAYLNLAYKELKHNGTSWGDDAKFNIIDNVSTTTDNNAQTVLIGQKTVELPYFIAGDE